MPGVITQGVREGHPAIDIACITGTPVRAAHDGRGFVRNSRTHGTTFELRGDDGLETSYSHLHTAMPPALTYGAIKSAPAATPASGAAGLTSTSNPTGLSS